MFNFVMIVFEQSMIFFPLVLGSYISFSLLKVPDLSLETAYLIGASCGGYLLQFMQGYSLVMTLSVVLCGSILGGMLVGCVSSCITRFGNIPHLLSSIITFGLFQGLFLMFSQPYVSLARYDNALMIMPCFSQYPELLSLLVITMSICCASVYLFRTQLGYSFAIFGYNSSFFQHFKISTNYVFMVGVVIANGLAGLAGFFFAQTNNLIEMNMGVGKALFCITALILGKIFFYHVKNSVLIPLSGTILYFALQQTLLKVGFDLKYFTMVQSMLVLVVLLTIYNQNRSQNDQLGV